eukprot:CAMPEP_0195109458 /NCGR_PEP_ID=MMETSP0448-20130528/89495_1 /TAXON_ID=66468 /ORGANISM="Heterocapsa triquestra, Strain CCMP 448" /LENGTH=64 /DNA_ID=CAMNT_0040146077 /DNA_START=14 /DNA_END=205 /DNA_ORIENTATION=+
MTHLLVRPANASGENAMAARFLKIVDATGSPPSEAVAAATFEDRDGNPGLIAGRVRISVRHPEP